MYARDNTLSKQKDRDCYLKPIGQAGIDVCDGSLVKDCFLHDAAKSSDNTATIVMSKGFFMI